MSNHDTAHDTADRALVAKVEQAMKSVARRIAERQWQPIQTAPVNVPVLIGGGSCPRVHENTLRDFRSAGRTWAGLGTLQQPTHWMPLPSPPDAALVSEEPPR